MHRPAPPHDSKTAKDASFNFRMMSVPRPDVDVVGGCSGCVVALLQGRVHDAASWVELATSDRRRRRRRTGRREWRRRGGDVGGRSVPAAAATAVPAAAPTPAAATDRSAGGHRRSSAHRLPAADAVFHVQRHRPLLQSCAAVDDRGSRDTAASERFADAVPRHIIVVININDVGNDDTLVADVGHDQHVTQAARRISGKHPTAFFGRSVKTCSMQHEELNDHRRTLNGT